VLFARYYLKALRHYAGFDGRARRIEYGIFFASKLLFVLTEMVSVEIYSTFFWKSFVIPLYNFIWACIPILLVFSLKDKSKQIIGFILSSLYLMYIYYSEVVNIINPVEIIKFQF